MSKEIVYAIGDIHGRADLLDAILTFAEQDAATKQATPRFVFLGDVADCGDDSRAAIDLVLDTLAAHPQSVLVKGNHDDWFVRFLDGHDKDPNHVMAWLQRGGQKTIQSYACSEFDMALDMVKLLHSDHVALFRDAARSVTIGSFHFVHAGVDPNRSLEDQDSHDTMWIRKPFLDHVGYLQKIIVHGHTVVGDRPVVTENRISIDTGAFHSGRLTVMSFDVETGEIEFNQTDGCADCVINVDPILQDRGLGTFLSEPYELPLAA